MSDKILYPHENATDDVYMLVFDGDQVWDVGGAAFGALVDANWADYDTIFTQLGTISQIFSGTFPSGIPAGVYDVLIFSTAALPAAIGDTRQGVISNVIWDGTNILGPSPTEIDTELTAQHGAGSWQAGSTAVQNLETIAQSTSRRGT